MNKLIVLIAIVFGLVLAGCQTAKAQNLTKTEAEYKYFFAATCTNSSSQANAELAKVAQGTRYASIFNRVSQELAKLCAESPQSVQAKNEWLKRHEKIVLWADNSAFIPFTRNSSLEKEVEAVRIVSCSKEIQAAMKEMAQLGIAQDPSRAKRIKRRYAKAVQKQKKACENTPGAQKFLFAIEGFWTNQMRSLNRAVKSALGI